MEPVKSVYSECLGECRLFCSRDDVLLLQSATGATLLLSEKILPDLLKNPLTGEAAALLTARGFAIDGRRPEENESMLPQPLFFLVDLTRRCNNRCSYCFRKLHASERMDVFMLDRIGKYITDYCHQIGSHRISVQCWGGEPLTEWNLIKRLQDILSEAQIEARILVETNGVPLTAQIAREMYERRILCSVSLDGPADLHDRNRKLVSGGGSHAYALRGLNLLRDAGYGDQVGVVCVATSYTLPHVERLVDYFACDLNLHRVKINIIKDSPELTDKTLCVREGDIARFWKKMLDCLIAVNERGISFGENTILSLLHNLTTRRCVSFCHSRGCQGGNKMVTFGMDGRIYPCDLSDRPELAMGSIEYSEDLLSMVMRNRAINPFFRQKMSNRCLLCDWRSFCSGGCTAMRLGQSTWTDGTDCIRNETLYPLLVDVILKNPQIVSSLSGGEIVIA